MTYTKKFHPSGTVTYCQWANTLGPEDLGFHPESGWTVTGDVQEDWFEWVNYFEATHPVYGKITGDFEDEVTAESKDALDNFLESHQPQEWDYWDI